ncbi:hypothetical protein SAMN04487770_13023 [Butyrivibrio sp. ob235]|uniref:hypothetical protein n=1 Tax=Butyrivibrio sp. ob235 TaxID=1761780 RepID=UPI0008C94744|nr:hypothetical protein [Butyrivibrio sp. ob235]SEM24579.1 hypothetical protein SAMN04487770_13023 [Butyrivibrio sp. ob235]
MSVENILQYAFDKFDEGNYDEAMKAFVAAHVASDNPGQKADIFGVVYENFIHPNEEEFREAYYENINTLTEKGILKDTELPGYDECSLMMVPVSDTLYYIWNKAENRFYSGHHYDFSVKVTENVYRSIDSIIIDDFSDLKMILDETSKQLYRQEYIILDNIRAKCEFFSFMMIPKVAEQIDQATCIFLDRKKFLDYLYETGNYIPRTIKTASNYDYAKEMSDLHIRRISEDKKRTPFVAITMPTFNRGKKALENVKRLQALLYDEEVAFVICNNSSTEETEYYDEIEKLSHSDSRIKYFIKPSKCFMDSAENVFRFNEAKYTLFCSDEDFIIGENFGYALEELNRRPQFGVYCFGVRGENYYLDDKPIEKPPGSFGLQGGFGCNYMTGTCIKPEEIEKNDLINRYSKYRENNEYYYHYTHCVYLAYLAHKGGLWSPNIPLFYDSVGNDLEKEETDDEVREHIRVEGRIKESDGQVEILQDMDANKDEALDCVLGIMINLYMRVRVAYGFYYKGMSKLHSWDEVCEIIDNYFYALLKRLGSSTFFDNEDLVALYINYEKRKENEHNDIPVDYRDVMKEYKGLQG